MLQYDDFIVTIEGDGERGFRVRAKYSFLAGNRVREVRETPPFQAERFLGDLPKIFENISSAVLQEQYDEELIKDFSGDLFNQLFQDSIKEEFDKALDLPLVYPDRGLRIRLQLPPELQAIPWELMYRSDQQKPDFLCNDQSIVLVRTDPKADQRIESINLPLRVLVVVSSPRDHTPLNARKEIERLLSCLSDLIRDGKIQVDFIHGPDTLDKMQMAMRDQLYHILHFVGHGETDGDRVCLIFEDANQQADLITPETLRQTIRAPNLPRLVFLNVCKGAKVSGKSPFTNTISIADGLLRSGIPAVIAHQFEISDDAAEILAKDLYRWLAQGAPVDEALTMARLAVRRNKKLIIESHTPVLFLYNFTGQLFNVPIGAPQVVINIPNLVNKANNAERMGRWSEAADYAQEVLITQPDHTGMQSLRDRALKQEALDSCIREARLAEGFEDWENALFWYGEYLNDSEVQSRPPSERQHVAQMKERVQKRIALLEQIAQARIGVHDPWLKWKG